VSLGRAPRLPGRARAVLHLLLIVAGWALFFWSWATVVGRPWEYRDLWLLIVVALVGVPAITGAWVLHNVALYKRLGPRRSVRQVRERYKVDFKGRRIVADWEMLRARAFVTIENVGRFKRYRAARHGFAPHDEAGEA
jgi:hypothetical protein